MFTFGKNGFTIKTYVTYFMASFSRHISQIFYNKERLPNILFIFSVLITMLLFTAADETERGPRKAKDETTEDDFDAILQEDAGEHTAVLMFHSLF